MERVLGEQEYEESLTDNTVVYPVVGVVGQIRAGLGGFTKLKGDTAAQDAYIASLRENDTNWYNLLPSGTLSRRGTISPSAAVRTRTPTMSRSESTTRTEC